MRKKRLIFLLYCFHTLVYGQQFNYSLIDFTHQRINPATTGLNNQWYASIVHREQNRGADFKIRSTALSAAYPQLFPKKGNVRGALGIDMLNDVSGLNNSFKVREIGLSYALRLVDEELQSLNLGLSVYYQDRGFDFSQVTTNNQYISGRGFDLSLANGENLIDFHQNFYRLNTGVYWQKSTSRKQKAGHFGISAFDLNRPKDTFYSNDSTFDPTYFLTFGFMSYNDRSWHVYPNILLVNQAGRMLYNASIETTFTIDRDQSVSFKPRYLLNRELVAVFEYQKGDMVFGVSYDIPLNGRNSANQGTFEFGMKIIGDVRPKARRKKNKQNPNRPTADLSVRKPVPDWPRKPYAPLIVQNETSLRISPLLKLEHPAGTARVELTHTFYYASDQATLIPQVVSRLREVIESLEPGSEYLIYIEGHTDSSGPADYNMQLSVQRANSIANFLEKAGLDRNTMEVVGHGEQLPIANNDDRMGRALNRRVELRLILK